MRVRYQMYGSDYQVSCDMTLKSAKRFYDSLKHKGLCMWAELVGEDDDNYMEVLDSFDNSKIAKVVGGLMEDMGVL